MVSKRQANYGRKLLPTRPYRGGTREIQLAEENTEENHDNELQKVKAEGRRGVSHIRIVPLGRTRTYACYRSDSDQRKKELYMEKFLATGLNFILKHFTYTIL